MTIRELATHYARYFAMPGLLAANAPEELHRFFQEQPATYDRYSLHNAMLQLAGQPTLPRQMTAGYWLAATPHAHKHCDEILGSKKPPKTWAELLDRAYASAQQEIVNAVRNFLKTRIESF